MHNRTKKKPKTHNRKPILEVDKKKCSNTKNKGENKNYSPKKSINNIDTKNQRRRREKHTKPKKKKRETHKTKKKKKKRETHRSMTEKST